YLIIVPSNQKEPGVIEVEPAERPSMDHCSSLKKMWRRVPMISRRAFSSMAHLYPPYSVMLSRPGAALAFSSGPYRQDEGSRLHITPEPSVTISTEIEGDFITALGAETVLIRFDSAVASYPLTIGTESGLAIAL